MTTPRTRGVRTIATVAGSLGCLAAYAVPADAAVERFHRFEVDATAHYVVTEACPDGSTAQTRVTVIGGREKESVNGEPTLDSEFATVFVQLLDCDGEFVSDTVSGPADFAANRAISRASVQGTVTADDGTEVTVDLRWSGTGELDRTRNVTTFPGFRGVFVGREREASALGTVAVDGVVLVEGAAGQARLETLEDRNRTRTDG